jgi:hypothetical protein
MPPPLSRTGRAQGLTQRGPLAKPKREEPFKRYNITFSEELHGQVLKDLPYEGARDFSSYLELAAKRMHEAIKAERKGGRKST